MKKLTFLFCLLSFSYGVFAQNLFNSIEKSLSSVVTVALFELSENDAVFGFGDSDKRSTIAYKEALDLSGSSSAGSGFVIDYQGSLYIVTNAHVVDGAADNPASIGVFDIARKKYPVQLIGGDSFYDIAVLAFEDEVTAAEFPPIPFAEKPARLTEKVYAIGNPLGKYPYTVTDGIVSGKNRVFQNPTTGKYGFLQHTATLIWGNSGGPLVNENGALVGVNTWIGTDTKDNQSYLFSQLNFAIEADLVQRLVKEIIDNKGRVRRNFLGIEFATRTDFMGLDSPPFINNLVEGSPADALLKEKIGYYITSINQEKVRTLQDVLRIIENTPHTGNFELSLEKEAPDFSNSGTMAGFKKSEKITVKAADLSVENLEKIANHFFSHYSDYQLSTENNRLNMVQQKEKTKPRIERMTVKQTTAHYEISDGQAQYEIIGGGLFDKWARGTLYRARTLKDMGAIIRLCSIEGHLSASVLQGDDVENVRFFLQDADFNELRVLYF